LPVVSGRNVRHRRHLRLVPARGPAGKPALADGVFGPPTRNLALEQIAR
jgi:hypothetical protein